MLPRTILINPNNLKTLTEEELLYVLCNQAHPIIHADTPYSVKYSKATVTVKVTHSLIAHKDALGDLEYTICKEFLINQDGFKQYVSFGRIILDEEAETATTSSRTRNNIMSDIDFDPKANKDRKKAGYLQVAMLEAYHANPSKNYFAVGVNHFTFVDPETKFMHQVYLNSTQPLVIRQRENYLGEFRLEVFSIQLGKGSYGMVHQITTLIFDPAVPFEQKREDRVIKLSNSSFADAQKEHEKSEKIWGHSSKSPLTHVHQGKTFFSRVERLMPGVDLSKLLTLCRADHQFLSTDQRLWLMKQGLEQLNAVHRAKIVHRDVKPENIRVDLAHLPRPKWEYIDFGLAKWISDNDRGDGVGTPVYVSPEMYDGKGSTVASDSYALGIIFGLMVGADENPFLHDKTLSHDEALVQVAKLSHRYQFTNLFSYPHNLSDTHKTKLEDIIKRLVLGRAEDRIKLLSAFNEVCNILMEREIAATPDNAHMITNCFTLLKKLTEYLDQIGAQSIDMNARYFKVIKEKLIEICNAYLKDDAHAQYFVSIQSFPIFEKCKTVNDVTEIFQKIFTEYAQQKTLIDEFGVNLTRFAQLIAKREDVDKSLKEMTRELLKLANKLISFPRDVNMSLDSIAYFTRKVQKRLPAFKERFDYLKQIEADCLARNHAVVSSNPATQFHAGSSGRTETSDKSSVTPKKKI